MIEKELAQKVLAEALRTGADLAEIYVEDVVSLQLRLDDSRLEQAVRGSLDASHPIEAMPSCHPITDATKGRVTT
jgi:predicted methyltransferase MtxX (methanogen marker protein 4)